MTGAPKNIGTTLFQLFSNHKMTFLLIPKYPYDPYHPYQEQNQFLVVLGSPMSAKRHHHQLTHHGLGGSTILNIENERANPEHGVTTWSVLVTTL